MQALPSGPWGALWMGLLVYLYTTQVMGRLDEPNCSTDEWWDGMHQRCAKCEPCVPDQLHGPDRGYINPVCVKNNPDALPGSLYYPHCTQLIELPKIANPQPHTDPGDEEGNNDGRGSSPGSIPVLVLAPLFLLGVSLTCGCFIWRRWRLRNKIPSTTGVPVELRCYDEPVGSKNPTTDPDISKNLIDPDTNLSDTELDPDPEVVIDFPQRAEMRDLPPPVPSEHGTPTETETTELFTIHQSPPNPVTEGDRVELVCVIQSASVSHTYIRWRHISTGRNVFGLKMALSEVQMMDGGEYELTVRGIDALRIVSQAMSWTLRINKKACIIEITEEEDRSSEHSLADDTRPLTDDSLPLVDDTRIKQVMHADTHHHANSCILPSGARNPLELLITMWEHKPLVHVEDGHCCMRLRELLDNHDAMVQLAVLLDPNNTVLRSFAVSRGGLTQHAAKYIEYCTRGEGNTVRGFITYITSFHGQHSMRVYDFTHFIMENLRTLPYVSNVVQVLHFAHRTCAPCRNLYRQLISAPSDPGTSSTTRDCPVHEDVRYIKDGPDYSYHEPSSYGSCSETLNELLNESRRSQDFRENIKLHLEPAIWRGIGATLGGFSNHLLDYLQYHYEAPKGNLNISASLHLLENLVTIYPSLKVAALIDWLLSTDHPHEAAVLTYHHTTSKPCQFCQDQLGRS